MKHSNTLDAEEHKGDPMSKVNKSLIKRVPEP